MGLPCLRLSSWKSRRAADADARIRVLQAPRHLRDVALHLHHVVEHEVRQHRDGVLSHPRVRVVQRVAPLLQTV